MPRPHWKPRSFGLSALLLGFMSTACGDVEAGLRLDELPSWMLEPEIRIGSVDDPDYAFSWVRGLEVAEDGTIYSVHGQEAALRRWTADGRPAGTVGRSGEGPGEFTRPGAMGWRGDSLWVLDYGNYRFNFFAADGRFLTDFTPRVDLGTREQAAQAIYPPRPSALLADGSIYGETPAFSHEIVEGRLTEIAHVRISTDSAATDTIAVLPVGPESVLGVVRDDAGTFMPQPFSDAVIDQLTYDGTGLLVLERPAAQDAGRAEFRLTRLGISGDTVFSRTYPYETVTLPGASVDSVIEVRAENFDGSFAQQMGFTLNQWRRSLAEAIYAPPHYPPVTGLLAGRDGTVWLGLNPPAPDGQDWLVLSVEGEPLGKVFIPEGTRVVLADRHNIWGVELDSLDVQYIVRYAVTTP